MTSILTIVVSLAIYHSLRKAFRQSWPIGIAASIGTVIGLWIGFNLL